MSKEDTVQMFRRRWTAPLILILMCVFAFAYAERSSIKNALRPILMQIYACAKSIYANQVYRDTSLASIWPQGMAARADVSHLDRLAQLPIQTPWKVWSSKTPATSPSIIGKTYYVDGKTGSDSNSGLSLSKAFATTQHAANVVQAGDTVLIAAGTYHSTIRMINGASGEPGKPITFGSYGNGPVIIDGSPIVTTWRQISGSVWDAHINFKPIAVVINDVPLKPSLDGAIGVTPNSGLWYATPSSLRVDFGRTTPAKADIVIPSTQNETVVYFYNKDYLIFNGLTVRGSGAGGIWGYGSNIVVSNCNLEFNGKAGINFMRSDNPNSNNKALYNRVYQNAMLNWPRGNNGFAEDGGGWSGGLVFSSSLNGVARGNLVYDNGGEGMISYGSAPGIQTGGTLFEKNVSMDNWSANMYFDNQPNDTARQNMLFFSGYDTSSWLKRPSAGYPWDTLYKMNSGISIGDECNSSGNCSANLANIKIYNNLVVGFRLGIAEYAEGKLRNPHGLKNTLIANNTVILPPTTPPNTYTAGIFLRNNGSANYGSIIVNNIVVAFDRTEPVIWYQGVGPDPGVRIERNAYYNQKSKRVFWNGFLIVRKYDIKQWQQHARCDLDSFFTNPEFVNLKNLIQGSQNVYDYRDSRLMKNSPLLGTGQSLNEKFNSNLEGMPRGKKWNIGAI